MRTPLARHKPMPRSHTVPLSGQASSVCPSQSLSKPSQTSSAEAPATAPHTVGADGLLVSQTRTPVARQAPSPTEHTVPLSAQSSSVLPSQSLSRESQTSGASEPAKALQTVWLPGFSRSHTKTPVSRQVPSPTEQIRPLLGQFSSVRPSQSLSRPSQISSSSEKGAALHTAGPAGSTSSQIKVPVARQMPSPTTQMSPLLGHASSVRPSQSLSSPSQISGTPVRTSALQIASPAASSGSQIRTPEARQTPMPKVQPVPFVGQSSSVAPSQSLSRPSHSSRVPWSASALQAVGPPGSRTSQIRTPLVRQAPVPAVHTVPRSGQSSSVAPSQSLSKPSQTSAPLSPGLTLHTRGPAGAAESQPRVPLAVQVPVPTTQTSPFPDQSSSVPPSQSLSKPSQISASGAPGSMSQIVRPPGSSPSQTLTPVRAQSPVPSVQRVPLSVQASSVCPSQLLSSPSQTSRVAEPASTSQIVGPWLSTGSQAFKPVARQVPVPTVQMLFLSGQASSVWPSQSLSRLSQTSSAGTPASAPQTVGPAGSPLLQTRTPVRRHIPRPSTQMSALSVHSSSVRPSQSLSMPSQTSAPPSPAVALHTAGPEGSALSQTMVPEAEHAPALTWQTLPLIGQSSSVDPSQSLSTPSQISSRGSVGSASQVVRLGSSTSQIRTPATRQAPTPT